MNPVPVFDRVPGEASRPRVLHESMSIVDREDPTFAYKLSLTDAGWQVFHGGRLCGLLVRSPNGNLITYAAPVGWWQGLECTPGDCNTVVGSHIEFEFSGALTLLHDHHGKEGS